MQHSEVVRREATLMVEKSGKKSRVNVNRRSSGMKEARRRSRNSPASIDQSGPDDLERVKDTSRDHVDIRALGGVVTHVEVLSVLLEEVTNNDGSFLAGVVDNLLARTNDGFADHGDLVDAKVEGWRKNGSKDRGVGKRKQASKAKD